MPPPPPFPFCFIGHSGPVLQVGQGLVPTLVLSAKGAKCVHSLLFMLCMDGISH